MGREIRKNSLLSRVIGKKWHTFLHLALVLLRGLHYYKIHNDDIRKADLKVYYKGIERKHNEYIARKLNIKQWRHNSNWKMTKSDRIDLRACENSVVTMSNIIKSIFS